MFEIVNGLKKAVQSRGRKGSSEYLIGFDLGTTAIKAAVFDRHGHMVASYSRTYPKRSLHDGWVEQDPYDWVTHIEAALQTFSKVIKLKRVAALCVCSQVNTHVFVDQGGKSLVPAIVWQDTRAKDVANELNEQFSHEQKMRIWGFEFVVDSSFALSRALWMERNRPKVWKKTRWILSPKDFCNLYLCGQVASDAISSVGLATEGGEYVKGLDDFLASFSDRLPPLADVFEQIGTTSISKFPELKAAVYTGTMDAVANFLGSGIVKNGLGALVTGTSSIIGIKSDQINSVKGIITFPQFLGGRLHAGPTQSGSEALAWFARSMGTDLSSLLTQISSRKIQHSSIIFLPHLQGERAPLWDANARGTFVGLTQKHDLVDMGLAVAEGVAFSERHLFDECVKAAGITPDAMTLSGGASRNNFWSQLRANVIGINLDRTKTRDSGIVGSAIIAGVGSEFYPDATAAAESLVSIRDRFQPDPDHRAIENERYQLYRASYTQLKPIFDKLAST